MKSLPFSLLITFLLSATLFPHTLEAQQAGRPDHSAWDALLQKHVNLTAGTLNYKGVKADKAKLEAYLTDLSNHKPADDWTPNEKLAYWMNVYNAFTVKLIVDNYPLKSINDLEDPWGRKFIVLGGTSYSLNQVENSILRRYTPLIHFGINCASVSCPRLYNQAFTPENVHRILAIQVKSFLNTSKYNQISARSPKVSSIFDWYKEDFTDNGKSSVAAFINRYASNKIEEGATLQYLEYNWNLNDSP